MSELQRMTRRRRVRITEEDAAQVKRMLWAGYTQVYIAKEVALSQTTVYQISVGLRFEWVPWPGGSTGPMPEFRIVELNRIDRKERKKSGRRRKENSADEHIHAFRATASEEEKDVARQAAEAVVREAQGKTAAGTASIVERMRARGKASREKAEEEEEEA